MSQNVSSIVVATTSSLSKQRQRRGFRVRISKDSDVTWISHHILKPTWSCDNDVLDPGARNERDDCDVGDRDGMMAVTVTTATDSMIQ